MTGPYTDWIMDLMSKDIYKYRRENEQLKEIIQKFISGEYSKEKLVQEYQGVINKNEQK